MKKGCLIVCLFVCLLVWWKEKTIWRQCSSDLGWDSIWLRKHCNRYHSVVLRNLIPSHSLSHQFLLHPTMTVLYCVLFICSGANAFLYERQCGRSRRGGLTTINSSSYDEHLVRFFANFIHKTNLISCEAQVFHRQLWNTLISQPLVLNEEVWIR